MTASDAEIRDVATRWNRVLSRMVVMSEASAIRYDGDRVKGGGAKSAPPPGVRFGRRDLRDLSLHEYWRQRKDSVRGDFDKLRLFLYLAERDLLRAQKRQEPRDPHENTQEREQRVIDQYEGLSALEAALAEDCPESWMRRVRLTHQREPNSGWPAPSRDIPGSPQMTQPRGLRASPSASAGSMETR